MTVPLGVLTTPYSSAYPLITGDMNKTWITGLDQLRLASYDLYERIYWTVPTTFKLTARGYEDHPIYVPTGRAIVEATHRYTAPGFRVTSSAMPGTIAGTDVQEAQVAIDALFARERFYSSFSSNKRFGLIRGDWLWHITADPLKPPGSRITITPTDPGQYFPITADDNVDKIIGCHLVSQITVGNDQRIHRLTYRKDPTMNGGTGGVTVEEALFEMDKWQNPGAAPVQQLRPVTPLPPQITALPVYHIKNFEEPQNPFGSSEMRGLERIMAAVNQSISDEELSLALDGIGVYWTDAPNPRDPQTGQELPWAFGPGTMIKVPAGKKVNRLTGVAGVTPGTDHRNWLIEHLNQASGTPDIAVGVVDVQVAQSGIALALQMGPMLARTDEKDLTILDTHRQMLFDILNGWLPAYEQLTFTGVFLNPAVGDKVPIDREKRMEELNDMLDRGVIDTQYYRDEVTKLGYTFPADMAARVQAEQATRVVTADPFAGRVNVGLGGADGG